MKKYMFVLHYTYPALFEIKLTDEDDELTGEEILKKHGFKEDDCSWMFVYGKRLELETIE